MALSDLTPVIWNTDGSPILLTTSYQDIHVPNNGHTQEVFMYANNKTDTECDLTWRFKGGDPFIVKVPPKETIEVIPGIRFLGNGSTMKIEALAETTSALTVVCNVNRVL